MFTDAILELLEIKEEEKVDFGQFLLCLMTYALFETVCDFCSHPWLCTASITEAGGAVAGRDIEILLLHV